MGENTPLSEGSIAGQFGNQSHEPTQSDPPLEELESGVIAENPEQSEVALASFDQSVQSLYDDLQAQTEKENIEEKKSPSKTPTVSYASHNLAIALAYRQYSKDGLVLLPEVKNKYAKIFEAWDALASNVREWNRKLEEVGDNVGILQERITQCKTAADLVYAQCLKSQTATPINPAREATMFGLEHTAFDSAYAGFFRIQLVNLLSPEQWQQLLAVTNETEAESFIASKPFSGKRFAEIGGSHSSAFIELGASVDNPSTIQERGLASERGAELNSISLSNYSDFYSAGSYDCVTSHMVLDKGTGFEYLVKRDAMSGDANKSAIELLAVSNHMLRPEGVSMHVGGYAYPELPFGVEYVDDKLLEDRNFILMEGLEKPNNRARYYFCGLPRRIAQLGHLKPREREELLGLQPIACTQLSERVGKRQLGIAEQLAVYKKVGNTELDHRQIENL